MKKTNILIAGHVSLDPLGRHPISFIKTLLLNPDNEIYLEKSYLLDDYETLNEFFLKNNLIRLASIYPMILNSAKDYKRDMLIPEGIVKLLRVQRPTLVSTNKSVFIDSFIIPGTKTCLCTPHSLKEINTSTLDNTEFTELVLNEGLEKFIIDKKSNPISVSKLVIPSTLEFEEFKLS